MLSAIGKLFNWESDPDTCSNQECDLKGIPLAKDFQFYSTGSIKFRNESDKENPVIFKCGSPYIMSKYPEFWSSYQPNENGCVNFLIQIDFPNEDNTCYYLLGMDVEMLDKMIETIDDENFQKDGYKWKFILPQELPEDCHVYDFRIFMNDFFYHYFGFGFIHDLIQPIKINH